MGIIKGDIIQTERPYDSAGVFYNAQWQPKSITLDNLFQIQDIIVIIGDFNAKVGDKRVEDVVGLTGVGTVNEHGSRLVECCQTNDFTITNTGIKTILGDSGLGRAPEIEVETK
ncbi:craniofacial development protein 2-like protein [Plakobranchus ocellatus]|uniref:Craniofacial development protein 2-like protein n=1 Tax=Plakobranchus ocellatus TaxID=259542 RepID=A0AAV4AB84_9GAST|nr:craniofacial development protein 2-like protein [Plakobranchus ocellatus]